MLTAPTLEQLHALKLGTIAAAQESLFGPIWIEWRGDVAPVPVALEEENP